MAKKKPKKGKQQFDPETQFAGRIKVPNRKMGEQFGRVIQIYGNDRGKIKKRVWIRQGDLVIINPWDWETETQGDEGKCEITWRYTKAEISWLERKNKIPEILDINNIPL